MKSIMHSDYWVEVPAGEFLIGISPEQENFISDRMKEQFGTDFFPLWKKRKIDGRLYPWGDEWDPDAGWFYKGRYRTYQEAKGKDRVDAYPRGVSPYGVYGMVGYLPQVVGVFPWPGARGCHPDETTAEMAWIDHMAPFAYKRGEYISLRPVLDQWPKQHGRVIMKRMCECAQQSSKCWMESTSIPAATVFEFPSWMNRRMRNGHNLS